MPPKLGNATNAGTVHAPIISDYSGLKQSTSHLMTFEGGKDVFYTKQTIQSIQEYCKNKGFTAAERIAANIMVNLDSWNDNKFAQTRYLIQLLDISVLISDIDRYKNIPQITARLNELSHNDPFASSQLALFSQIKQKTSSSEVTAILNQSKSFLDGYSNAICEMGERVRGIGVSEYFLNNYNLLTPGGFVATGHIYQEICRKKEGTTSPILDAYAPKGELANLPKDLIKSTIYYYETIVASCDAALNPTKILSLLARDENLFKQDLAKYNRTNPQSPIFSAAAIHNALESLKTNEQAFITSKTGETYNIRISFAPVKDAIGTHVERIYDIYQKATDPDVIKLYAGLRDKAKENISDMKKLLSNPSQENNEKALRSLLNFRDRIYSPAMEKIAEEKQWLAGYAEAETLFGKSGVFLQRHAATAELFLAIGLSVLYPPVGALYFGAMGGRSVTEGVRTEDPSQIIFGLAMMAGFSGSKFISKLSHAYINASIGVATVGIIQGGANTAFTTSDWAEIGTNAYFLAGYARVLRSMKTDLQAPPAQKTSRQIKEKNNIQWLSRNEPETPGPKLYGGVPFFDPSFWSSSKGNSQKIYDAATQNRQMATIIVACSRNITPQEALSVRGSMTVQDVEAFIKMDPAARERIATSVVSSVNKPLAYLDSKNELFDFLPKTKTSKVSPEQRQQPIEKRPEPEKKLQPDIQASDAKQEKIFFGRPNESNPQKLDIEIVGDQSVSRNHGYASFEGGAWKYTDTSTYGTTVVMANGTQHKLSNGQSWYLKDGDEIRIGKNAAYRFDKGEFNRVNRIDIAPAKQTPLPESINVKPVEMAEGMVIPYQSNASISLLNDNCGVAIRNGHESSLCEDHVMVTALPDGRVVLGVYDGMGGYGGGDVASKIAATSIMESLQNGVTLKKAYAQADMDVNIARSKGIGSAKMGTAAATIVISPDGKASIANVGDCRVYVVRNNGNVEWITDDQGSIDRIGRKLKKAGNDMNALDEKEQSSYVGNRHYIGAYLGEGTKAQSYAPYECVLKPGDRIVVVSDGIGDVVTNNDVKNTVWGTKTPSEASSNLVNLAETRNEHEVYTNHQGETVFGKPDDRSVAVYQFKSL